MDAMRIALGQINTTVGDLTGNRELIEDTLQKAETAKSDLLVLPEMAITGYPPMDLLERSGFVEDQLIELERICKIKTPVAIALGVVMPSEPRDGKVLENCAVLIRGGKIEVAQAKSLLPTYDVFDEKRYFAPATQRSLISWSENQRIGMSICEDAWVDQVPYGLDPIGDLAARGANVVLNLSASPWHAEKPQTRRSMLANLAKAHDTTIVFVNQVGGNDELIFDGGSFVVSPQGKYLGQSKLFEPDLRVVELESSDKSLQAEQSPEPQAIAQLEKALVLGVKDYFRKQGLPPGAVIGLSGGIDSAVTAHIAVRALTKERVLGIAMPGPFSSEHSVDDALELGKQLGIQTQVVDIRPTYEAYTQVFEKLFGAKENYGIAQQNIQSRIRGSILMAVSNAENRLVLATGNKSELSVGYCTLYGDTVGGLAVLGDVYKRDVYALARFANLNGTLIPQNTIEKPPSAELAPDQFDTDDLPSYDILDAVLAQTIEGSLEKLPTKADNRTIEQIRQRLDRNEYKRRQSPLVLRVSNKAFGTGRRLPIVHKYDFRLTS